MKHLSRVVWSEGMYLGPHHFQVQSRYFEDSIRFATSSLWYQPWGLIEAAVDAEALRNGTLGLLHARGAFADGLPFQIPECDPAPAARPVAEIFPPTRDRMTAYLAIPERRPQGRNTLLDGETNGTDARFIAENRVLGDDNTGRDERPVRLGRKNFRLVLDVEPFDGMAAIPIVRIMRDGAGRFAADPAFIPPLLDIAGSERLMAMLRRLVDILEEKSATMTTAKSGAGTWAEYSTRDIAKFWLLHTVNSALAPLRHRLLTRRGHPEELFTDLLRLGGALCTFAIDSHPRTLPAYDHRQLDECFGLLDEHIRRHLETIIPTNCISVQLEPAGDYFHDGVIHDDRVIRNARWILAVRSSAGEPEIINRGPQLVKLCSKLFVRELVKRALPGLALTHLPVPPSAIPVRVDTQYFSVNRKGPCWDHIVQSKQVGVYVPGELPKPELELFAILET
ncbi:MAG: type VI secretion system baseplate subunit TssK [Bryobacteraceae bacterium]|nr:type VI secretion system baseplate subunit TssK [Bryobacteraceae bacterium]